jgi:O-phosphoseryl-tRNA synthetase
VILDRCYYLGGLTRPDIGISQDKIGELKTVADVDVEKLKQIFRMYREGRIEGDDVLETMVHRLKIRTDEAAKIVGLFPQFSDITPVCGKTTLRSHMTAAWFPTLAALQDEVPQRLFSIGLRFRREQRVDASHLRAHYGGSIAVMDEDISLQTGMEMTNQILNALDFGQLRYELKKATSNYYAPDTEYEVYSGDIEVADIGMYSPVALAEYDIEYNVFNLGFGLERILMVKNGIADVRQVLYPQFYAVKQYTDGELAKQLSIASTPQTKEGRELAAALKKTFTENADSQSPCEYKAYEGPLSGRNVSVCAVERESNTALAGPAALNDIYVYDAGIYALPRDTSRLKQDVSKIIAEGVTADFSFLDSVCAGMAAQMEEQAAEGKTEGTIQYKMAKAPSDVNIKITAKARRYVESRNKPISLKGPVFCAAHYSVK